MEWTNDNEMRQLVLEKLYTPVVGDIMDEIGLYHQFLPQKIGALQPSQKVAGFAMPVLMIDVFEPQKKPFGYLTEALDDLQPGEVYIATGGTGRCAYWGELLTATARTRGAVGAVIDGWHRDTPQVLEQNWPVFSWGSYGQDSSVRTQVVQYRCEIEIGKTRIRPGDFIFGDQDGVLVIPKEQIQLVVSKALEKAKAEKVVRKAIENGMSATEAFSVYGVL